MLLLLLAILGCSEPPPPATADGPDPERIREARALLGPPMVDLAETVIAASMALDAVRHDTPRGELMVEGAAELAEHLADLRRVADEADVAAAAASDEPPVDHAAARVAEAAQAARDTAEAVEAEQEALAAVAALDVELDQAVAVWREPGSQSERRQALAVLADQLRALGERAEELDVVPAACTRLQDNRREWLDILVQRSERLAETARSSSGARYSELLESFAREPYGEDRGDADAADRSCWRDHSEVAKSAQEVREYVEELERALNP